MNCKPGDLAIVISSCYPADIGMIVEVVRPADDWIDPLIPEWECKSNRISVSWDVNLQLDKLCMEFDIPDAWLRPVSGLPVEDQIFDEVTA